MRYEFDEYVLNSESYDLSKSGDAVAVEPQVFKLLLYLLENRDRVVSKDELISEVWDGRIVSDAAMHSRINAARAAVGDSGKTQAKIKTYSKRGIRFIAPVNFLNTSNLEPGRSDNEPPATGTAQVSSNRKPPRSRTTHLLLAGLFLVIAAGLIIIWASLLSQDQPIERVSEVSSVDKPRIAVLPFDAQGEDAATARLSRGITEDIITDLARFPEFGVIARNSTEVYAGKGVEAREVGADLGVDFVLEGSIQRNADALRITAQLIDARTGAHEWAERWDRKAEDLFRIQTEIAETVANRLGSGTGVIQQAGRTEARRKRPEDLDAYELYLLGTERLEKVTKEDIDASIRLLSSAVEKDPNFARAWVELYHAYNLSRHFGADSETALENGRMAAERAIKLDPSDAEAHIAYGSSLADRGEFARAKASFDTALNLAPNAFEILTFYATWATTFGVPELGAKFAERAISLNPNFPLWAAGPFAWAFFHVERYEDTLRMLELQSPENYTRHRWVMFAASHRALGHEEEATEAVRSALERFPDLTIEGFFAADPSLSKDERANFARGMELAGFPPCAEEADRRGFPDYARLAQCEP